MIAHGGAVAGALKLGLGCGSAASLHGSYSVGNVSSLGVGDLVADADAPLAVGRDAGGIWAMTLICTHAGCDMATDGSVSASGVVCNCHGSRFDENGNVLSGPARSPLSHFQVTLTAAGDITVDTDITVSETTRVPVP
jgi:Rieske Fe-S protein